MRANLALLAVLLLAGCMQAPAPTPTPTTPAVQAVHSSIPVSATVYARDTVVCPPMVSCVGGRDVELLVLKKNQTLTGFAFDAEVVGLFGVAPPPSVHVQVFCTGAKPCTAPLAEAEGKGTLHLLANVSLPPETILMMSARSLDTTPDPLGFAQPYLRVSGKVEVLAIPGKPPNLVPQAVHLTGMTGPCILVVECSSGPGYFEYIAVDSGAVHRIDLTLNWTAQTDLSRELELYVACSGTACSAAPSSSVLGTSPLHLLVDPADYPAGSEVYITVSQKDPTNANLGFVYTRQTFVLDGHIDAIVDEED